MFTQYSQEINSMNVCTANMLCFTIYELSQKLISIGIQLSQISKERLDDVEDDIYPPMIKLDIKPAPSSGTPSDYIYIDVMGVGGKKKFGVCPKLPEGRSGTPYTVM